jgi:uncharacterized protein YecT (DUF1311 family)
VSQNLRSKTAADVPFVLTTDTLAAAPPFTRDRIKAEQRAWLKYRDDVVGRQIREEGRSENTGGFVLSTLEQRKQYLDYR